MTERIFPAAHRRQHPGLVGVFDENAAQNDSTLSTYLQERADRRVLTTLVEELFRVLDYTIIPVGSRPDAFDTVIRKGPSEYPSHTISEGKPSRTALQKLTAAHTNSNVPHSILVSAVTPPSEQTNRVSEHSGVRVIKLSELRELVQAVITRLTDPVTASRTEERPASATPAKVERLIVKLEAACDKIDTLVDQQEFAEATKRHDTVHDAVSKTRSLLPAGSANRHFRERLSAVETRVSGLTSAVQAAYAGRIATGDSHVETVNTPLEDGDVTTGLRACEDARAAYTDTEQSPITPGLTFGEQPMKRFKIVLRR